MGATLVSLCGITRLTIDPANERLFAHHTPSYKVYQHFLDMFGSDEAILVALHDPVQSILTSDGIVAVGRLTQALETLSHVASVVSLTNVPDMTRLTLTPFGISVPRLVAREMLSREQIASIRRNPLVLGTVLSGDLHTAGLLVMPDKSIASPGVRETWIAAVRAVARQHTGQGRQTYVAGTPLERAEVTAYLERDQRRIVPLVFFVLWGMAWMVYRVKRLALIPVICVGLSLAWTMGLVGFIGVSLNVITSLLAPVVMVVSVSAAIHLINRFLDEIDLGKQGAAAMEAAMCQVGVPCFLTSLTTALGFFSLLVSPVPAIRDFALFAGLGVLLSFIVTMMCVPMILLHTHQGTSATLTHRKRAIIEGLLRRLVGWVAAHRGNVFWGTLFVLVVSCPGIWRLTEGTDIVRALRQHAPLRVSTEFIDHHLTGANAVELLVRMPDSGGLMAPAVIRRVLAFSRWLREQPGVTAVMSPWEPLHGVRTERLNQDEQLRVLAAFLSLDGPLEGWLRPDRMALRISIRVTAMRSDRFLTLAQRIHRQAEHQRLPVQVTGNNYLLAQMSKTLVRTQIRALGLAVILVLGSIALALRSWQLGLLAAIPNILPPLIVFGLMGWCGIPLSTATMMIASVALGLIVDDTIHLLHRYRWAREAGQAPLAAIEQAMCHTGRALIVTTVILTLGFWVGILGSFRPTVYFAFLTGLTMVLALLADLLVTPAVLLTWQGKSGRRDERDNML